MTYYTRLDWNVTLFTAPVAPYETYEDDWGAAIAATCDDQDMTEAEWDDFLLANTKAREVPPQYEVIETPAPAECHLYGKPPAPTPETIGYDPDYMGLVLAELGVAMCQELERHVSPPPAPEAAKPKALKPKAAKTPTVRELKAIAKERGLVEYSHLRKAELLELLGM